MSDLLRRFEARLAMPAVALGLAILLVSCASAPPTPEDVVLIQAGERSLEARAYDQAEVSFRRALVLSPDDPRALHGLARIANARGRIGESLEIYGRIALVAPSYFGTTAHSDYCRTLADGAEREIGLRAPARASILIDKMKSDECRASGMARLQSRTLLAHAEAARRIGHRDQSIRFYRAAVATDPSWVDAYLGAAEVLLGAGQRAEALALLSEGLARHPHDARLRALVVAAHAR